MAVAVLSESADSSWGSIDVPAVIRQLDPKLGSSGC